MLKTVIALAILVAASGTVVHSPTDTYTICSMVSVGGNGAVNTAISRNLNPREVNCTTGVLVALKCGTADQTDLYAQEAQYLASLRQESWALRLHEHFIVMDDSKAPCIATELLGRDLEKIRLAYNQRQKWSWVTLGSIGARMIEAVESLHRKYNLVHRDLHPGNWMLTRVAGLEDLTPTLKMIDFGDCRPLEGDEVLSRDFYAFEDLKQVIISIRYLFDGNFAFYAWKRYKFNQQEICNGIHPRLCKALLYVRDLKEGDVINYAALHEMMVRLVEDSGTHKYTGSVIWGPVEALYGPPRFTDKISAPKPEPPSPAAKAELYGSEEESLQVGQPLPSYSKEGISPAARLIIVALLLIIAM